jgi:sporulation protein YlmC with PRC-barrel domain
MKFKLLSGAAIPALLVSTVALAQDPAPPPAPAEKMPSATEMEKSTAIAPSTFSSQQAADEWRSTKLVGLNVYNENDEKIGDINDLILDADGKITSAVVGVGGFLGMGEKLVAVPFADLKFGRDANGNVRVTLASTKEALEKAPDFKYKAEKKS